MVGPRKVNRKKTRRGCFPFSLAAVLTVAAMLALSYLWLCSRCDVMAESLKNLEAECEAAGIRLVNEEYKWARLSSPESIEKALTRFDLPLVWPSDRQVVYLSRRVRLEEVKPTVSSTPQLAQRSPMLDRGRHD